MINWWSIASLLAGVVVLGSRWPEPGWILFSGVMIGFNAMLILATATLRKD